MIDSYTIREGKKEVSHLPAYQGKGTVENSIKFLFIIDPLCNQNVSADWWKCLTFLCSSHIIPRIAEQGAKSEAYTYKHLTCLPRAIIASISLSEKREGKSYKAEKC